MENRELPSDEAFHAASEGRVDTQVTSFVARNLCALAAVEVILSAFTLHELAGRGQAHTLGNGFAGFHHMVDTRDYAFLAMIAETLP